MKFCGILFAASVVLAVSSNKELYKDNLLIETPNNQIFKTFREYEIIDVWEENPKSAVVRLTPTQYKAFASAFPPGSSFAKVLSNNVQELADSVFQQQNYKEGEDWFANYHTYDDIKKWYIKHSIDHSSHVKFVPSIGKTWEHNDIFAVHLSNPSPSPNGKPKNKIWFQSLIHAREWISGPTTQYIFDELLKNRDTDPKVKKILDENEIIFIPVVNPDGYKFTNEFRFWRKNRYNLHGVDINRNFPYRWGGPGASKNPLADDYRGTGPGSELETQAIINYYKKQGKIAGAIDFHSFSQLVLRPWGDTKEDTPHESVFKKLGDSIRDIIKQSRGTEYTSQKAAELYEASGGADDWFYGEGKSYSFTLELSPKDSLGPLGFVLPPSEIKPVGKEIYPAIIHFIEQVSSNPIN